jgi:hypothetical protein
MIDELAGMALADTMHAVFDMVGGDFIQKNLGVIRPIVDGEFALSDVAAAQARMESGEHLGKIVLAP